MDKIRPPVLEEKFLDRSGTVGMSVSVAALHSQAIWRLMLPAAAVLLLGAVHKVGHRQAGEDHQ